jgi:hypothetical protein
VNAGATHPCRACSAPVPDGAARCPRCEAAQGPFERCPHCRAEAGISPHPVLRYVCDVCGGPRVPRLDPAVNYSGREDPLLRKADAARKGRAGWRAAAIGSGLLLPFTLLFFAALLAFFGLSFGLFLATAVVVGPIASFLASAISHAGKRGAEIGPAIDAAWIAVATDIAQQSRGAITAQSLAQKLGIEEPQAEELIAPRVRIEAPPLAAAAPPAAASPTQLASAEEEAAIAEQAAAEVRTLPGPGVGKP